MALSTFDDLLEAVPRWAWQTDEPTFVAAVPEFIALTEHVLNNGDADVAPLRVREMEAEATIALAGGRGALPADFLELRFVSHGADDCRLPGRQYRIIGDEIVVEQDTIGSVRIDYYTRIPALSASAQSNWLIAKDHRVYLYGALVQAAPFMREDERLAVWGSRFAAAIAGIVAADNRARHSTAVARTAGPTP